MASDSPTGSGIKVSTFDELVREELHSLLLFILALFLQPYVRVPQQLPKICFGTQGEVVLLKQKCSVSV